jgi:transaldolase
MKATQLPHNLGQSIWLDNITRDLLDTGILMESHRKNPLPGLNQKTQPIEKEAAKGGPA